MKILRVGGSVRDEILQKYHPGLSVSTHDLDYVMIDVTETDLAMLRRQGYREVGTAFPGVFLHPETADQYCIPRSKKRGYDQLVDDLCHRDLTCNAIAVDEDGEYVDPFGGTRDIQNGILRHVSRHFADDPIRVLRLGRFAARFGFDIAPETIEFVDELRDAGSLDSLQPDRVLLELHKGFSEASPQDMILFLHDNSLITHIFGKYALVMVDNVLPLIKSVRQRVSTLTRLSVALVDFWNRMSVEDMNRFLSRFTLPSELTAVIKTFKRANREFHTYTELTPLERVRFLRSLRRLNAATTTSELIDSVLVFHGYQHILDAINDDTRRLKAVGIEPGSSLMDIESAYVAAL